MISLTSDHIMIILSSHGLIVFYLTNFTTTISFCFIVSSILVPDTSINSRYSVINTKVVIGNTNIYTTKKKYVTYCNTHINE